jgi:tRNA pseudouridine55 synthase
MFSAKKIQGKKLYDLARQGISIERQPVPVRVQIQFIRYEYPHLELHVSCSKGTYIRSLAHDIGLMLGTYAHLSALTRLRSGSFHLADAISQTRLQDPHFDPSPYLRLHP